MVEPKTSPPPLVARPRRRLRHARDQPRHRGRRRGRWADRRARRDESMGGLLASRLLGAMFFEEEEGAGLKKRGQRDTRGEVGDRGVVLAPEPAQHVEQLLRLGDRLAEVAKDLRRVQYCITVRSPCTTTWYSASRYTARERLLSRKMPSIAAQSTSAVSSGCITVSSSSGETVE